MDGKQYVAIVAGVRGHFPHDGADELVTLAADIKANGLRHAIIVDDDGMLIDGRNRLAACKLAEVEPRFEKLNGHDAKAVIVSENLNRRFMSVSQRAMALAMIYPEPTKQGNETKTSSVAEEVGVSSGKLSMARTILRVMPETTKLVLAGGMSLDVGMDETRKHENINDKATNDLERLRKEAPDIATCPDDLTAAVLSIVYWIRIILSQKPVLWFRVEDQQAKLRDFAAQMFKLPAPASYEPLNIRSNVDKPYFGVKREKPKIAQDDWNRLADPVKADISWYCATFGYESPLG